MTRLATAAPALITAAAALLLAAAAAIQRALRHLRAQPSPTGHRRVVEDALWDWWITTDPMQPFEPADVAVRIDEYLRGSGFTIAPDLRKHRMPTRRTIAGAALIAVLCAASATWAATRGEWGWAAAGAAVTALLTREAARDLTDRRRGRGAR